MCGVCGALGLAAAEGNAVVHELNGAQAERGPDNAVTVDCGQAVLGNTRLAIQDPTDRANQPFEDPGGRFVVVFNGEIYNFKELARQRGIALRTGCDGEVIANLWALDGVRCLDAFQGMYAIAVYDRETSQLFLARDPFGIKPLYWRRYGAGTVYASDPRALWRLDRNLPMSPDAVASYLRWGAVPADRSAFAGIEAVAPGECIVLDGNRPPVVAHSINAVAHHTSGAHETGTLASAFRASVRRHLVSDVPTALLLSAGIDSTLIALAASELGASLHCLTVTGDVDAGTDESMQAQATALEYGHSHEVVPSVLDDAVVDAFFHAMHRPTIDGLNTFLVNRAVRAAGFKVALSGLGGDEALAGYDYAWLISALPVLRAADRVPLVPAVASMLAGRVRRSASGKVARLLGRGGPRRAAELVDLQRELFDEDQVVKLAGVSAPRQGVVSNSGGYPEMAEAELLRYLEPMLLPDADCFSMASSVELRVPFVDVEFFRTALHRDRLRGKRQLVQEMGNDYLRTLARRPKTGFTVPMQSWIADGGLRERVAAAAAPDAPLWTIIDRDAGLPIVTGSKFNQRWSEPWSLVALDGWLRAR